MLIFNYSVIIQILYMLIELISCEAVEINSLKPFNDNSYVFSWNIDEMEGLINITINCATTGWVGFGLSDTGLMPNSDLVICYVYNLKDNLLPTCYDGYAKGYTFSKDESLGGTNDLVNIIGSTHNGRTVIKFSKKLNSQDEFDKVIAKGIEMKVLFSYRENGNPSIEHSEFREHSIKTMKPVVLWPADGVTTEIIPAYKTDSDVKVMKINVNNISLKPQRTYYTCTFFNVKNLAQEITQMTLGRTYHAIALEANPDNMKRVHHMALHACKTPQRITSLLDKTIDCTLASSDDCMDTIVSWTPGVGAIVIPQEAGIVWGSNDTEFVKLQIHYNNIDLADGETDSSYFNVYFTPILRQYDSGMMSLGLVQTMFSIPPGKKSYDIIGSCTAACTGQAKGNITIFGYTPHGHMTMNKLVTEIKQADNSTVILKEDPYSFHKARFIQPNPPIVVAPGFYVKTTCSYDTSSRTNVTKGGIGAEDEMCYNYVMYYPKENGFSWCLDGEVPIELFMACVANEKVERVIAGEYLRYSYLWLLLIVFIN
jgi:hypothetical protein